MAVDCHIGGRMEWDVVTRWAVRGVIGGVGDHWNITTWRYTNRRTTVSSNKI